MKTIADIHLMAKHFNYYFTEIGPNLANKIEKSSMNFEGYIKKCNSIQPEHALSINELKDTFSSLDINKSPDCVGIIFAVLKNCFGALHKPLLHVFNLSIVKRISLDIIKIARVTIFKGGDKKDLGKDRPISDLTCFSKILERTMYNRLYNHLIKKNILYSKKFGFQKDILQTCDNSID